MSSPEDQGLEATFRVVVSRPVAVLMMFTAALVFGWVSYQRLPVELMPDISYPTITVRTAFDGAAPQEVESQISRPIEESLATLDGLATMESRSRAGASDVVLGFYWGTDMGASAQTIRESLQTTWLPKEADRPLILRYDPTLEPILRVALSYDGEGAGSVENMLLDLRHIAEQDIKRKLEAMPGVAAVRVIGGLEREIRAEVREDWLAARSLTMNQVQSTFSSENVNLAGGSILEGDTEYLVRTLNEYSSVEELGELRIRRSDGVMVPLSDVAVLSETHKEREVISRLDGVEAVELEIYKEADANVVQIASRVKSALFGDGPPTVGAEPEPEPVASRRDDGELEFGGSPVRRGLSGTLPDGMRLMVLDDQAEFIEAAVTNLRDTAVLGGAFAVLVLFLFLRDFRATTIIGTAIPLSVLVGFAPLYLWGVSLNLMSLGGLALGVGMLVDNAVVVLESIQRFREAGESRHDAAVHGVSSVAVAVTASTMTTVAVFSPIAFVEGVGGELFGDLSMAVVGALLVSLVVALFGVPTWAALGGAVELDTEPDSVFGLLARWRSKDTSMWGVVKGTLRGAWRPPMDDMKRSVGLVKERPLRRAIKVPYIVVRWLLHCSFTMSSAMTLVTAAVVGRVVYKVGAWIVAPVAGALMLAASGFQAVYRRFETSYEGWLGPALAHPGLVAMLAAVLFAASVTAVGTMGAELLPEVHQGRFTVEVSLPVGTPLSRTSEVMSHIEEGVASVPGVALAYATIGADARVSTRSDEGQHTGRVRVQVAEGFEEDAVMDGIRAVVSDAPSVEARLVRPELFSFRAPLEVVVFGRDLEPLQTAADEVARRLSGLSALRDVKSSLQAGHPEIRISYDRERLHRFGLDTSTAAATVRDRIQGVSATNIHRGDLRMDLTVRLAEGQRASLADVRHLNINPSVNPPIPLDAVAYVTEGVGPSEIRRVDQQRAAVVSANLSGFDLAGASEDIEAALIGLPITQDMSTVVTGQFREMNESLTSLRFALILAIFLVYVIMASTFENLVHPLVILFSVPLALVGVVGALGVMGLPLSVVVFIGLIVLAGVVVNNAIVLVDTINRLRSDGLERMQAIRQAATMRLRPILITTATTVLGLAPISLGLGEGAEIQQPLAITVIGGLVSSTMLTLVVIPAVYALATRTRETRGVLVTAESAARTPAT